jgi:predicted transcriptional regulator
MPTVKLDVESHKLLQELAGRLDVNMSTLLKEAIRRMQRELFWQGVREDFERLREDKEAWESYLAESEALQSADGLTDETDEWAELYPELDLSKSTKRGRK